MMPVFTAIEMKLFSISLNISTRFLQTQPVSRHF